MSVDPQNKLPDRGSASVCVLAAACFVLAAASITFSQADGSVAAIWPMNAVVLALMLRTAQSSWMRVAAAAFAGNVAAAIVCGGTALTALALSAANTVEVLVIASVLTRRSPGLDITRLRDLVRFIAWAGSAGPAVSATIAATALSATAGAGFAETFLLWFVADSLGMLIFGPAALTLSRRGLADVLEKPSRMPLLLLTVLAAFASIVFAQPSYPLLFVPGPVLIFIAFRVGISGVGLGLILTAAIAIVFAVMGQGPTQLVHDSATVQIMTLQAYLAFLSLTTLPVATALAERDRMRTSLEEAQANLHAAREEAEASERRFRQMAEVSSDTMARMDMSGTIRFVSPSAKRMLGYEVEEIVGRTTMSFTHPDDVPGVVAFFADLVARGPGTPPMAYQFRARRKDGAWMWLEGIPQILWDTAGAPVGIQDSVRDITARKILEADLDTAMSRTKSSAHRLELAIEIADIVVFQRNKATGEVTVAGPEERVLGRPMPRRLGIDAFFDLVHVDDRADVVRRWSEHLGGSPRMVAEHRLQRTGQWVRTVVEMTRNDAGEHTGSVGLIMNINDRKAAEVELKDAHDKAEKASRAKADFLANMSHEIRTPLNSIIGFGALLTQSRDLVARDRNYVEIIEGASRSLLAIVNDVLDFSGIEEGAIKLHPRAFALLPLIEQVAESFLPAAREKGLTIEVHLDGALTHAHIGDDTRLRQILVNLVGNAVKFTHKGSVTVTARAAEPVGGIQRLVIEVADTGIGIAAEKISGLFTRFTQADTSINRRFGGSGLGLAISKRLTELMGGTVEVRSTVGKGTTFCVTVDLPCTSDDDVVPGAVPESNAPATPRRILVADDVDLNRHLIKALLEPLGHVVDGVADGGEAIRAVQAKDYDLVLMDVQMPGVDGLAAARAIRDMRKRVPLVAMTAQALPAQIEACRTAGMDDYLAKPIVASALLAAVRQWTKTKQTEVVAPADAVMAALREKFIDRCRDDLREIHKLMVEPSEVARVRFHELVHRLAGTAGTLGFPDVGKLACELDQVCAVGEAPSIAGVRRLIDTLENLVRAA